MGNSPDGQKPRQYVAAGFHRNLRHWTCDENSLGFSMVTADVVSDHVVIAAADDHLSDAASRMLARRAQHCVVVDDSKRRALGLIRFVDVAARTSAASRTLADLNPDVPPLKVGAEDPAEEFAALLEKNDIGEAVVEGTDGGYVGRVTVESAFKWMLGEVRS